MLGFYIWETEIHQMAAAKEGTHRQWMLLNQRVGPKCMSALLGLGYNRIHVVSQGRVDLRYKKFGFVPGIDLRQ